MVIARGDIFLVAFDPARGHEIKKPRPALVIQNDIGNERSPLTIVAAITSKISLVSYPVEVVLHPSESGLPVVSSVLLNQIRTVDRVRLLKKIGKVGPDCIKKVDQALRLSLHFEVFKI